MNNVYCIEGDPDYGCIYVAAKNGKCAKSFRTRYMGCRDHR
jgi:hypothetical protein